MLRFNDQICVLMDANIRQEIIDEVYTTPWSLHLGTTKMYHELKSLYWWFGMKRDVVGYVARSLTCQEVNAENQRLAGLL